MTHLIKDGQYHYEYFINKLYASPWRIYIGDITIGYATTEEYAIEICKALNARLDLQNNNG